MTYEYYPQAIEGFVDFTHDMAVILDMLLTTLIGEEAAWANHIGIDSIPNRYLKNDLNGETLIELWRLRGSANSLLLIEGEHQIKKWAKLVSEVNETCKQQRKTIEAEHNAVLLARKEITRLDNAIVNQKQDEVNRLKAILFLIGSSIRDGNIGLTHWRRDERLKHLHDVITNQIKDLDKPSKSYEDDF